MIRNKWLPFSLVNKSNSNSDSVWVCLKIRDKNHPTQVFLLGKPLDFEAPTFKNSHVFKLYRLHQDFAHFFMVGRGNDVCFLVREVGLHKFPRNSMTGLASFRNCTSRQSISVYRYATCATSNSLLSRFGWNKNKGCDVKLTRWWPSLGPLWRSFARTSASPTFSVNSIRLLVRHVHMYKNRLVECPDPGILK